MAVIVCCFVAVVFNVVVIVINAATLIVTEVVVALKAATVVRDGVAVVVDGRWLWCYCFHSNSPARIPTVEATEKVGNPH